jgi:hypothetical protein
MPATSIFGLVGIALLGAACASVLARRWVLALGARIAIPLAATVLMLVPVGGLAVAGYLRGVIGDLSITSVVLLIAAIASSITGRTLVPRRDVVALCGLVSVAAVGLYPLALGASTFDPYALGFGSISMATALLLVTAVAWYARLYLLVLCLALGVAGYLGDLLESDNLWDYLIDVSLALYAVALLLGVATRTTVARTRSG